MRNRISRENSERRNTKKKSQGISYFYKFCFPCAAPLLTEGLK